MLVLAGYFVFKPAQGDNQAPIIVHDSLPASDIDSELPASARDEEVQPEVETTPEQPNESVRAPESVKAPEPLKAILKRQVEGASASIGGDTNVVKNDSL
jgi:hypothetical protein